MLLLDPRKKGTPSTLEKKKFFFFIQISVFGGSLTLSFLLLTCTSSSIKQALRKKYEWISKQMPLNEKVHAACFSVSQYSSANKTKSICTFTCSQIQSEKRLVLFKASGYIQNLGQLADNVMFILSAYSTFHSVHTKLA